MQTKLLNQIESTSSRTEKESLLAKATGDTKTLLTLAFDPMVTFGITLPKHEQTALRSPSKVDPREWWVRVFATCGLLAKRSLTGGDALREINAILESAPSEDDFRWAGRLINKDLRAGVGVTTLVKVFPGLVTPFEVALAKPFDPDKHHLDGHFCLEPKLDGLRMVIIEGIAYTRNGHRITSVDHIINSIPQDILNGYVLDGEVLGADFDETSGDVRQKQGTKEDLVYNVFDMVALDEWRQQETRPLAQRKADLQKLQEFLAPSVQLVKWVDLEPGEVTPAKLLRARDIYMKHGFEGAMVKDMGSSYIFKRSTVILKVKKMETVDGKIVSFKEGKGKDQGKLGALQVKVDGVVTSVGGGYSDAQREDFWKHRNQLVGRTMEVQYQNFTKDGALRFPVFVRFRRDLDE